METTVVARAGFKRRRSNMHRTPVMMASSDAPLSCRKHGWGTFPSTYIPPLNVTRTCGPCAQNQHHENFLGSSFAVLDRTTNSTTRPACQPDDSSSDNTRERLPTRRRSRCSDNSSTTTTALWRIALALGYMSTLSAHSTTATATDIPPGAPNRSSNRLCAPAENTRAYVTTLAGEARGQVLGPRVLAQSLRSAGAKGDIVVLVPLDRATGSNVDALRRDGLTVHIVPRGLQTAGGEIASEDLMTKIFLWSLTSFDRVVYLDPRSLIQKNPDALFACEGFCAAGAVPLWESDPNAAALALAAEAALLDTSEDGDDTWATEQGDGTRGGSTSVSSWRPSTSVMVLEPSLDVHQAMLDKLKKTTASVGAASSDVVGRRRTASGGDGSLEAQAFLSAFLEAGDHCTPFEELDHYRGVDVGVGGRGDQGNIAKQQGGLGGSRTQGFDTEGGFIGGAAGGWGQEAGLEDALQPVVLLNRANMPACAPGRERTSHGVCQRLPYTYAAPSTDFDGRGRWAGKSRRCTLCDEMPEPHIIHFADDDAPWTRLAYLHKPLFWRWNRVREQLDQPYGTFFAPWVLFFIPSIMLAFARLYYKTAGLSSSSSSSTRRRSSKSNDHLAAVAVAAATAVDLEESPSKTRRGPAWSTTPPRSHLSSSAHHNKGQLAILPASGMPGSCHGGAVGGTSSFSTDNTAGGSGSATGPADNAFPACLRAGVLCYVVTAVVGVLGFMWFQATRALAREVVDARWHPFISIAVYNAWLCCALVLGLYLMDYVYYLFKTRARTLLRDAAAVSIFVSTVSFLHGRKGTAWAVAIGLGIIALGFGHGSRPESARCLTGRIHFRCITASCILSVAASLVVCYGGASAHEVASGRVQDAASRLHMIFTALVYASVIGGHRLRADIGEAGLALDLVAAAAHPPGAAAAGTAPCSASGASVAATDMPTNAVVAGIHVAGNGKSPLKGGNSITVAGKDEPSPSTVWAVVVVKSALAWIKSTFWRRRVVAPCLVSLVLWPLSSTVQVSSPGVRLEKYGQSCLGGPAGFVEAGGKRLSKVCGAEQALRPVKTGAYFEAFRQDKVCLEVAGGGFLSLGRVHVAQACTPEVQFVFQLVQRRGKKPKPGSSEVLSAGPSPWTQDPGEYCVYNPTLGLYLSAQGHPKASCGELEHWVMKPAPTAPGLSRSSAKNGGAQSVVSMLLHPDFFSRGPLRTLYGYLAVATCLLLVRAVFAKLASSQADALANRGGGAKPRHGGLGSRRNSRGGRLTRSRNSGDYDYAGYFGDPGYAGDAETGSAGHDAGRARAKSLGKKGSFSLSDWPTAVAPAQEAEEHLSWGLDMVPAPHACGALGAVEKGLRREGSLARTKSSGGGAAFGGDDASPSAAICASGSGRDRFLLKLFSGLCLACDATLLAGLWCLIPTHFAQALSSLTHDHNSAIQQGLGMDDAFSHNDASDEGFVDTRGLQEGVIVVGNFGVDRAGDPEALSVPSCHGMAWWVMSAFIRWHLLFLVVAFCHLHGAVAAAAAVVKQQSGRDRRTGKRIIHERPSFWGLRAGERVAMRLRTGLGVLALLCVAATSSGIASIGGDGGDGGGMSAAFLGLHAHPAWGKCAPASGLDGSWGSVSPLLMFAVVATAAGVYVRAGATRAVRVGATVVLLGAALTILTAVGSTYFLLAVAAAGMDWTAWGIAGLLSCVCYQKPSLPRLGRDGSGGGAAGESGSDVGSDMRRGLVRVASKRGRRGASGGTTRLRNGDPRPLIGDS